LSNRSPKNLPASIRQKLLDLAHARNDDFGLILVKYGLERILWGERFTAGDMKKCVWLRPELVAQIEFRSGRIRSSQAFEAGLREDKDPRSVVKEPARYFTAR